MKFKHGLIIGLFFGMFLATNTTLLLLRNHIGVHNGSEIVTDKVKVTGEGNTLKTDLTDNSVKQEKKGIIKKIFGSKK